MIVLYLLVWLYSRRSNKCMLKTFMSTLHASLAAFKLFIFQEIFIGIQIAFLQYITFQRKFIDT